MNGSDPQVQILSTLIQLEHNARHAETIAELGFSMVNETLRLLPYRQALFWSLSQSGKIRIHSVSGTDSPAADAPFIHDLTTLIKHYLHSQDTDYGRQITAINPESVKEANHILWKKWSLQYVLWCPLIPPDMQLTGGLLLVRDKLWTEGENVLIERALDAYSHAFWSLIRHKSPAIKKLLTFSRLKTVKLIVTTAMLAALFMPVRLSVLAPVEIVPLEPMIVSSPMDGVVKNIHVKPNAQIQNGDLLLSLEDTGIRNKYEVSLKTLDVVKAEYMKAIQKSFKDKESRAQILMLKAEVALKEAEVKYADEILQLSKVSAQKSGIAVYSDQEDWLGKPVAVGQKVMIIANPEKIEAEIMLQVADALNLEPGADIRIFLNIEPDRPISATLKQADYEAKVTPMGELAFRLRASLTDTKLPRIGLRGTAKIYGKKVTLFYYLLRRPLTATRIAIGI